jgi:hypothetical protein
VGLQLRAEEALPSSGANPEEHPLLSALLGAETSADRPKEEDEAEIHRQNREAS